MTIAAEDELKLHVAIGKGVREALVDRGRRLRRAAIEAGERHVRGLRGRRETGEQAGADGEHGEFTGHCFFPWMT